ncbi:hypothetical protein H0H81_012302 [Sphagnurus paluster]|uniref:Uncharacterized protein n=1 Tax=Sphagnurus paluster TaxID=117069 RepID=A0A9P7G0G1_9AGAR|nr:hypothetical protein H0H81_012302 [Sphagnurus paluster]
MEDKSKHCCLLPAAMTAIKISYTLNPPAETVQQCATANLSPSKTQAFPVEANAAEGHELYYGALQRAIAGAKDQLGNELTGWRDAVGKAESNKETAKTLKYDADEEEEEE